jgi:hypothetical protein
VFVSCVCVVYVSASVTNCLLVQRNRAKYMCLIVCQLETSTVRRPRPDLGCSVTKKIKQYRFTNILFLDISEFTQLDWIVRIFKLNFDHRSCSVVSNCTSCVVLLINRVMINLNTCHLMYFSKK